MTEQPKEPDHEALAKALDFYTATTIPVHIDLAAEQTVLCLEEAEAILRAAKAIALGPCVCRTDRRLCDGPVEACLALNEAAQRSVETMEGFRFVIVDEALAALRTSHKAGLVHLAYRQRDGEIGEFCSCCSCCCWFLTKVKKLGAYEALVPSRYVARRDDASCIACGACVKGCPFSAWTSHGAGDRPVFAPSRCYGCGVCGSRCPSGALSLVERRGKPVRRSAGSPILDSNASVDILAV